MKDSTADLAKTVVAKASAPALRSGSAAPSSSESVKKIEAIKKRKVTDETVWRAATNALSGTSFVPSP